ncbi:MAG: hypothetical protein MUF48_01545 [Pirellulaceae bacterium]|jgi:hypothetical protein|nr:hypothetical protein [Pirellulaceae bacterium]
MRCEHFDVRLQQLLDHRRAPEGDPRLRRHAALCPRCHNQLTATRRLLRGIQLRELPTLDDDFAARVVQRVAPTARPQPRSAWLLVATALAATLLAAVMPQGPHAPHAITRFAPHTPPRSGNSASELAATTAHLPPNTNQPHLEQSWWTVCGTSILELYPEQARLRHRQQVSQLAEELRPIATPFNATVTVLRRTIPFGRPEPKSPPSASLVPRLAQQPSHA